MWVQISAGKAPIESCRFVYLFLQKLIRECSALKIKVEVIESIPGPKINTCKSVFLKVTGLGAREYTCSIEGSMLWIYNSEFRKNHKRKNWFIEVEVIDEESPLQLDIKDIKIETMRCSGNGGQNVNKLETGVRITHLPTNLVVIAQEERSQLQNKNLAMRRLQKKLAEISFKRERDLDQNRWKQHQDIKRGAPIRTFKGAEFKEIVKI